MKFPPKKKLRFRERFSAESFVPVLREWPCWASRVHAEAAGLPVFLHLPHRTIPTYRPLRRLRRQQTAQLVVRRGLDFPQRLHTFGVPGYRAWPHGIIASLHDIQLFQQNFSEAESRMFVSLHSSAPFEDDEAEFVETSGDDYARAQPEETIYIASINELRNREFRRVLNVENKYLFFFPAMRGMGIYVFHHIQDCCESVEIVDIVGDLADLEGAALYEAEEAVSGHNETPIMLTPPANFESYLWTFYRFRTTKGSVVLRWLGRSNGYYSERVTLTHIPERYIEDWFLTNRIDIGLLV